MPVKRYYAVIDFEATCWEDEERRGDQEIIEFGCVRVAREGGALMDEFFSFVRPTRYPMLSEYCTQLLSITQEDVDRAPTFPYVLDAFIQWLGDPKEYTFCSWGEFDRFMLRAACRFHRLRYPFDDEYLDIKPLFADHVSGRNVHMERALEMLGMQHEGILHRADDDARSVARIWGEMLRGAGGANVADVDAGARG